MADDGAPTYRNRQTTSASEEATEDTAPKRQMAAWRRSKSMTLEPSEVASLVDDLTGEQFPTRRRSSHDLGVKRLTSNHSLPEVTAEGEAISPAKQAVIWVKKAQVGSVQWVENCSQEQFFYWNLTKQLKPLWLIAKYGLLVISVFDDPAPCQGTPEQCQNMDKYQYSNEWDFIPIRSSAILSFMCYAILGSRMVLRKWALKEAYSFHSWHMFNGILIVLGMALCVLYVVSPIFVVISFLIRPLLVVGCTKVLRQTFTIIIRAMPNFIDIIVSLFVAVCVFVCVGMVLFVNSPEGLSDFNGWADAFTQMWILFTTANDPNAWVASFNSNKLNFFFFFIYLVFTLYLLLNLLLARVYSAYKAVAVADVEKFHKNEQHCIKLAFNLLSDTGDEHGAIQPDSWHAFFAEYCNPNSGGIKVGNPDDKEYNTWRGDLIVSVFHGVDLEAGAGIDILHFKSILKVFLDRETYIPSRKLPQVDRDAEFWVALRKAVLEGVSIGEYTIRWDRVMDAVILIQFAFTFWATLCFSKPGGPRLLAIPPFWPMFFISSFFALEVAAKISILGFERFWFRNSFQHRFDFFTVYPLIVLGVLYLTVPGLQIERMERAIILFNAARAFRLFAYVEPFRKVFLMCTRLIPAYWRMTMMLLIVYFVFAVVGRWMFGGLIYTTNPALAGSQYMEANFCSLNFNDFGGAFATLFPLMIVNNWYVVANGFLKSSHSIWVSIYFVTFFVVCNLIVLNILMALIIDVTMFWSEEEAKEAQKNEKTPRLDELQRVASGMGDDKPEHTLRKIFDKEDELYANYTMLRKPQKARNDDELGCVIRVGSNYGTM